MVDYTNDLRSKVTLPTEACQTPVLPEVEQSDGANPTAHRTTGSPVSNHTMVDSLPNPDGSIEQVLGRQSPNTWYHLYHSTPQLSRDNSDIGELENPELNRGYRTRSKGKVPWLPHVQPRTLEYRRLADEAGNGSSQ